MPDITNLLESALDDEPGYAPDLQDLLATAHRRQRRRRLAVGASVAGVGAGIGALAVVLVATAEPATPNRHVAAGAPSRSTAISDSPTVGSSRPADNDRLTKDTVAGLVENSLGIKLGGVDVSVLPPTGDIDLAAAIISAKGQYLNVQVVPASTSTSTSAVSRPSCADLSGDGPDGDGYTGPCTVSETPDGGFLVVRSGRTTNGRYAITEAILNTADGASVSAEASNQFAGNVGAPGSKPSQPESVVSHDPPLTSDQLRRLVLALNARR